MKRYRLTENKLRGMIREAVKSVLNEGDVYKKQWDYEIKIFMDGLKNGQAFEWSDDEIAVEYPRRETNENDPRFIVYKAGEGRLRDDHFCVQHSPYLSDFMVREIEFYMRERMGMDIPEYIDY